MHKYRDEGLIPPLLLCLLLLSGCASNIPLALRNAPEQSPALTQVQAQPEQHLGVALRWGGTVVRLENLPQATRLEIVSRALNDNGKPGDKDRSEGRFIAHVAQFLDPAIYVAGRTITVVGKFTGIEKRPLDQMSYPYPLVKASSHHLWPEELPEQRHQDPFLYDPLFYDPWYPFGYPYPYYPYRHWPYYH